MRRALPLSVAALAMAAALASCDKPAPAPEPTATPAEASGPRTLVPTNLALDELGPKIAGPDGEEVESVLTLDGREIGRMTSFVTCAGEKDTDTCDPEHPTDKARYTYVHHVTLSEPYEGEGPLNVTLFRTLRPVPGFANVIGYDEAEAEAALGEDADIKVQVDNGALVWRIAAGDGWGEGESLTFYWRSKLPPAASEEAYAVEVGGMPAMGKAPFPAEETVVEDDTAN